MNRKLLGTFALACASLSQPVLAAGALANLPVAGALLSGHASNTISGLTTLSGVLKLQHGAILGLGHDVPLIGTALAATGTSELSGLPGLGALGKLKLNGNYSNSSNYSGLQNIVGGNVVAAVVAGLPVTATSASSTIPGTLVGEVRVILKSGKR